MDLKIKISIAKDEADKDTLINDAIRKGKYYCYDCNGLLIPKKGNTNAHHYAHKTNKTCNGESWKHKYCKNIISKFHNNITCVFNCNSCGTKSKTRFLKGKSHVECRVDEYIADVAIKDENQVTGVIEIYHKHKTGKIKEESIVYKGIKYVEIHVDEIFKNLSEILNKNKVTLKCQNVNLCKSCEKYDILNTVYNFTNNYSDYFGEININNSVIEIKDGKLYDMFKKKIGFVYNLNDEIKDKVIQERQTNGYEVYLTTIVNNKKAEEYDDSKYIFKLSDCYINRDSLIAGSFVTNLFQECINNVSKKKNINWKYNDIDIWLYDEDGLIGITEDNKSLNYESENKYVKCLELDCLLNYIKTIHAKNIKSLLYNFDIPCCQIAFHNNTIYLTILCFYSLITGINIMNNYYPNKGILLEYVRDNSVPIIKFPKNSNKDFDLRKRHDTENPLYCNIYNANKERKVMEKYTGSLGYYYNNRVILRKLYPTMNNKFYVSQYSSAYKFIDYIKTKEKGKIDIVNNIDNWDDNILLLRVNRPYEFWGLIKVMSEHKNQALCNAFLDNNIEVEPLIHLMKACGVNEEYIQEIFYGWKTNNLLDISEHAKGKHRWGHGFEMNNTCITETVERFKNEKNVKHILGFLRSARRIDKYKNRGYTFKS